MLVLLLMYKWHTKQIEFVLAYPRASGKCDIYMKILKDFTVDGKTQKTRALKLIKNLYGQKQAGRVWDQHLHKNLLEIGWKQSKTYECLYYKGNVAVVVFVDDGILISSHNERIDKELKSLQDNFKISMEGTLSDYVGVNVERTEDNKNHMIQPNIKGSILTELNFNEDTKVQSTPAYSTTILKDGKENEPHKADWNYRQAIGIINSLFSSCRPDIACADHQCARFTADPRINHTEAIKRIFRYLAGTLDKVIIFYPTDHAFQVYADADFGGLWDHDKAADSPITAKAPT
jgi:Reverse transcriptase (RNA-dependent DNA polymerase)